MTNLIPIIIICCIVIYLFSDPVCDFFRREKTVERDKCPHFNAQTLKTAIKNHAYTVHADHRLIKSQIGDYLYTFTDKGTGTVKSRGLMKREIRVILPNYLRDIIAEKINGETTE